MAVKIRMARMGRRHRPFFRINAIESRAPRDGRILEKLGHYDPVEKDPAKELVLNTERIKYWLDNGAIPSDHLADILPTICQLCRCAPHSSQTPVDKAPSNSCILNSLTDSFSRIAEHQIHWRLARIFLRRFSWLRLGFFGECPPASRRNPRLSPARFCLIP